MTYDCYNYAGRYGGCGGNLIWDIYDDDCCELIKIAYSFYTEKARVIVDCAFRELNDILCSGYLTKRAFELKYGIYTLAFQRVNELVVCSLKKVVCNENGCGGYDGDCDFLGYDFGCFDGDFCKNAVASIVLNSLTALKELANIPSRLNLNRNIEECTVRLIIERLEDALSLARLNCDKKRPCAPRVRPCDPCPSPVKCCKRNKPCY